MKRSHHRTRIQLCISHARRQSVLDLILQTSVLYSLAKEKSYLSCCDRNHFHLDLDGILKTRNGQPVTDTDTYRHTQIHSDTFSHRHRHTQTQTHICIHTQIHSQSQTQKLTDIHRNTANHRHTQMHSARARHRHRHMQKYTDT